MLVYPADKDGWVKMAEQGSEFYVKEFEQLDRLGKPLETKVTILIDTYDDSWHGAWFIPFTMEQIMDMYFDFPEEFKEEQIIIEAKFIENLGDPPVQPREGYFFAPWEITNTGRFASFKDGEEILHKFTNLSGFPIANGIFYEEMEDE